MKDERRPAKNAVATTVAPEDNATACRPEPFLNIEISLEGNPRVTLFAESEDDEIRLRLWLNRNPAARRILDELGVAA